jgi:hypothetical protein
METKLHISLIALKALTLKNSYNNHKKVGTTSNAKPIIYISSTNERKTLVGWVASIRQKM